jgi:hypothetical protein
MTKRILLPFLCYAFLAAVHMPSIAEDKPMDVFAPMVGKWTTRTVSKPSQRTPKEIATTGKFTAELILNNRFIRLEGSGSYPTGKRMDYKVIMTYDQRKQTYRRWVFRDDGFTAESTGVWNADKRTITWSAIGLPKGSTFTITGTINKDSLELTMYGKRADGTVLMDSKTTARKE